MTIFSNVVVYLTPGLFCAADVEAVLTHLSTTCFVQCSITSDGIYQIEGSWPAIQDVYITLCATTGHTVELVQSLVKAAKCATIPSVNSAQTQGTQTDESFELHQNEMQCHTIELLCNYGDTVCKSIGAIDTDSHVESVVCTDNSSLEGNEQHASSEVKVARKDNSNLAGNEQHPSSEVKVAKKDNNDLERNEQHPSSEIKVAKKERVLRIKRKTTYTTYNKKRQVAKSKGKSGAKKGRQQKVLNNLSTDDEVPLDYINEQSDKITQEDNVLRKEKEITQPVQKRKQTFLPEYSDSPKNFIYLPDNLDTPVVQDLEVEQQNIKDDDNQSTLTESGNADVESDEKKESEILTACLSKAVGNVIKCNQCKYKVKSKDYFREHIRRRHLSRRHVCEICRATFGMHNDLLKHKRRSHLHKHICGVCDKVYRTVQAARDHVLNHVGISKPQKLYSCSQCSKTYQSATGLSNHHKIEHSGMERPFVCTTCGQRFWQKCHLQEHEINHSGKRPYMCPECGETFAYRTCLREHKKRHSTTRNYACETCGKSFKVMAGLRGHMKRHDESQHVACSVCNKKFATKGALERHSRTHTGEKPFACDKCGQRFNDSSILRRHRLAKHPGCDPNYHSLRRRTGAGSHGVFKKSNVKETRPTEIANQMKDNTTSEETQIISVATFTTKGSSVGTISLLSTEDNILHSLPH